jgi:hypothetical protein
VWFVAYTFSGLAGLKMFNVVKIRATIKASTEEKIGILEIQK